MIFQFGQSNQQLAFSKYYCHSQVVQLLPWIAGPHRRQYQIQITALCQQSHHWFLSKRRNIVNISIDQINFDDQALKLKIFSVMNQELKSESMILRKLKVSWFQNVLLVSSNWPKNQPFFGRISALASIKRSNKKMMVIYTTNWMILFWQFYTSFLIWPLFRG